MVEIKLSNGKVIKMRKPKVRDLKAVANIKNEMEQEIQLVSNLTGLTTDEIDDMDFTDYKKFQEQLKNFLL